jgi:hypothetical protein
VTYEDRCFIGLLAVIVGPLLILAGWLTEHSQLGPVLMIVGALHLAAAPLLRPTLRVIAIAPVLFGLTFGWHDIMATVV